MVPNRLLPCIIFGVITYTMMGLRSGLGHLVYYVLILTELMLASSVRDGPNLGLIVCSDASSGQEGSA
jgi:hypothetical protein